MWPIVLKARPPGTTAGLASSWFGVSKRRADPCTSFVPRLVTMLSVTPGTETDGAGPPCCMSIPQNGTKAEEGEDQPVSPMSGTETPATGHPFWVGAGP